MKTMKEISRLGRLRRFARVACDALSRYRLREPRLSFLTYNGNVIYRVDTHGPEAVPSNGFFVPNRYVLRIHMPYHSEDEIKSELTWLAALRNDAGLPVPEPVPTSSGELLFAVDIPGSDQKRFVSLLKWLDGKFAPNRVSRAKARFWGALMARLHEHASGWNIPAGFSRRHRDWEGLFGHRAGFVYPAEELWKTVPEKYRGLLDGVTGELAGVMDRLKKGPTTSGLVHADLNIKTNVLFAAGAARVIDFDDCCFAFWLHDLAFALGPWQTDADYLWIRDALLDGYQSVRVWPDEQLRHLDLFLAAFNANLMLWMLDWAKQRPDSSEPMQEVRRYGENMLLYSCRG